MRPRLDLSTLQISIRYSDQPVESTRLLAAIEKLQELDRERETKKKPRRTRTPHGASRDGLSHKAGLILPASASKRKEV